MDTLLATDAPATELDIALGDRTTVPELDAWTAFQTLRTGGPDLDRPLDDQGTTARAIAREKLAAYTAERRQYGRPVFPVEAARANKARADYHRGLFLKPLEEALPPDSFAAMEARAKLASDPERYRARQVLKSYLSDVFGTKLAPEQFDQARAHFAKQHLGLKDDLGDKAVFAALRARYAEDEATMGTIDEASRKVFADTLTAPALSDPRKAWEAVAPTIPERLRPAAREEFLANAREARRVKRKLEPGVTKAEKTLRALRDTSLETGTGETGLGYLWEEAADALPDDPQERGLALAMLAERMNAWPEDERAAATRALDAIGRGFRQAGRGFFDGARGTGQQVATELAPDSAEARMRQRAGLRNEKLRQLQNLQYAEGGSLVKASDSFMQRGVILAAQSLWTLPASLAGAGGVAALSLSFGGSRYTEARLTTPDADRGLQLNAAMTSGVIEAQIERMTNTLGLKALRGKMPGVAGMLNKAGVRNPLGRAAIGGTAGVLGIAATEYTEEALQEATNRGLQDIANELSGITPTTDWGKFFNDWSTVAGQEQADTLAAVIPFALIGGAGASFNHFHYGDYLRKNATLLRAVGVPEAKVEEIISTPDIAKADTALREAFADGLEARTTEQRAAAVAVLEEQAKLLESAGFPVVTEESNSFTEETEHVFTAPDGTREAYPTREEALEAWRGWTLQQSEDDLDTLTQAANQDIADFLTAEGMASEGTLVEGKDIAMTPAEAVRRGYASPEQMKARLEIFALQEGRQANAEDLRLFARRFSDIARDGIYRGTVQYFRGADPLNVIEDLAEDAWNRGLDGGALTGAELVGYIRQTEDATGQRYLADGYAYTDAERLPLLEALSKVSTEYVLGKSKAEALPARFRAWLDMIVAVAAATFRHARTLARSGNLMAAVKAGKIDARFERMVADSVGLDPAAIERRVTQEYQKQLAAEAMGGFPEVGDFLRGQLPHPDTARKAGGPLAGELRRIWDGLKTPTKRRRKDGRQVDDIQRAKAYFLPIGENADLDDIRQRANAKGFDFDTPADMLDALETSLLYGRPVYGTRTAEAGESSFSVGIPAETRATDAEYLAAVRSGDTATQQRLVDQAARAAGYSTERPLFHGGSARDVISPRAFYTHDRPVAFLSSSPEHAAVFAGESGTVHRVYYLPGNQIETGEFNSDYEALNGTPYDSVISRGIRDAGFEIDEVVITRPSQVKSADPVTYDGAGKVIPLSRRFNVTDDRLSFSIGGSTVLPVAETRSFPGAPGSPSVVGPASFSISAFHGTPHRVDRFRMDRIGTGEGAQVYGWGLYFAELASVAAQYARILGQEFRVDGELLMRAGNFGPKFAEMRAALGDDAADIIVAFIDQGKAKVIDELNDPLNDIDQATFDRAADYLDRIEAKDSGNLYKVTLKADAGTFLDWDKPLDQQSDTVKAALLAGEFEGRAIPTAAEFATAGVWYRHHTQGMPRDYAADVSRALLAAGIRGIRYLDGTSRARGEGTANFVIFDAADIEILEENGRPVDTASFSLSPKGIQRLEAAIAKKLTAAPEERAAFYQRLRDRLAALTLRLEDMDAGRGSFARNPAATTAEEERRRIRDAYAEARAIVDTLPMEARGRVSISLDDITGATTERGRVNALVRLIEQADDALETVLKKEYLEAFETLLDLAKPDLRQNKSLAGRLTPETSRLVAKVQDAIELDAVKAALRIHNQTLAIEELGGKSPQSAEEAEAIAAELADAVESLEILETFSAMGSRTAAELAHAFDALTSIYTRGRTARRILDEARRQELADQRREVLASLPAVTQPTWAKRTEDKGPADLLEATRLGLSSFHQVMEWIFPKSATARDFQDRIRAADRAFVRAKIDARERFDSFMRTAFDLTGRTARLRANRIIAAVSTRRDDWNIQLREGVKQEPVKLSPEQAQAILAGTLKPGWESDLIAMESLRQAYADFRLARTKDQSRAKFVRFSRIVSRGAPSFLRMSDLEAVYFLQLDAQEQYRPALDRYGFTAQVIEAIRAKVDPRALEIAGHLRREYAAEYDRLNPVFRDLFGLDMPRIRNYAPGLFESLDTKGEPAQLDAYGNPATPVNAMSAGFTKARSHHTARPRQANALAAYWSHLEATEYFISYAQTMRDARQVFRSPDVRRSIENAFGTRAAGIFSGWLDALETDGQFRSATVAGLQDLTTRTLATQSAIGLAYNVGTVFKQASAAFGVFMEMPTTAALSGIMGALRNPASLAHVWKQEAVQQRILAGVSPEDRRILDAAESSPSLIMEALNFGRLPIALADAAFTSVAGAVAYNHHRAQALKAGLTESAAESVALQALDRVVTRTAQPATAQDKSLAELTAHGFGRFLFLFRSDPRQKLANALSAIREFARGDMKAPEAARRVFWNWCFYGIMAEVMTDVWHGISRDDDDEERWSPRDYAASALAGPLSGLPLLGSALDYAIRSTIGTKAFANNPNPIEQAVARIMRDGFTSALWRTATAEEDQQLADWLNATLADTSALAQIAGAIDPRAAIAPAAARLTRDAAGILGNAAGLVWQESDTDRARKIIGEERKADSTATKARAEAVKATARQLEEMPAEARERQLATLDRDTRAAVESRLRRRELTETERGLAALSTARRAAAIARIMETLPPDQRQPFLDRLRAVRILTRDTEAAMPPPATGPTE
jgi:hypothetical protein